MTKFAQYLSTINLSKVSKWEYPLKTLPRPKGKSTRVIITEYDLPRPEAMPHDAAMDGEGMIWYSDFGSQYLGKLDPKTAKVVEYPVPVTKPGAPAGALDAAGRLVLCNERYLRMYGLSCDVVKPGSTLREIVDHRQETGSLPHDPERYCAQVMARMARVLRATCS